MCKDGCIACRVRTTRNYGFWSPCCVRHTFSAHQNFISIIECHDREAPTFTAKQQATPVTKTGSVTHAQLKTPSSKDPPSPIQPSTNTLIQIRQPYLQHLHMACGTLRFVASSCQYKNILQQRMYCDKINAAGTSET